MNTNFKFLLIKIKYFFKCNYLYNSLLYKYIYVYEKNTKHQLFHQILNKYLYRVK